MDNNDNIILKTVEKPLAFFLIVTGIIISGCVATVFLINNYRSAIGEDKKLLMILMKHIIIKQNLVLMI